MKKTAALSIGKAAASRVSQGAQKCEAGQRHTGIQGTECSALPKTAGRSVKPQAEPDR